METAEKVPWLESVDEAFDRLIGRPPVGVEWRRCVSCGLPSRDVLVCDQCGDELPQTQGEAA